MRVAVERSAAVGLMRTQKPVGPWKVMTLGGGVAGGEIVLGLGGVLLGEEGADLDAPAAGGVGGGVGEGFDADAGDAGAVEVNGLGGGEGEVEDAVGDEGARGL